MAYDNMNGGMGGADNAAFGHVSRAGGNVDLFGDEEMQDILKAIVGNSRASTHGSPDQGSGLIRDIKRYGGIAGPKGSEKQAYAERLSSYDWADELMELSDNLEARYEEGEITQAEANQIESIYLLDKLITKVQESGMSLDDISLMPQFGDQHMEEGNVHIIREHLGPRGGREGERNLNLSEIINLVMGTSMNRRIYGRSNEKQFGGPGAVNERLMTNMARFLDERGLSNYLPQEVRDRYFGNQRSYTPTQRQELNKPRGSHWNIPRD